MTSRSVRWTIATVVSLAVIGAIANSYLNTRKLEPGLALLSVAQRIFIQPSELWFVTYERVILNGDYDPLGATIFVFTYPIDSTKATSIQYLMAQALGESAASRVIEAGTAYNGGYPEIFFEMLGPYFAWLPILVFSYLAAALAREMLLAICQGRLLSAFAVMYVFFALLLVFASGMLNFLIVVTFWIKVAFMIACVLLEKPGRGRSRPIMPWVLWQPRATPLPFRG